MFSFKTLTLLDHPTPSLCTLEKLAQSIHLPALLLRTLLVSSQEQRTSSKSNLLTFTAICLLVGTIQMILKSRRFIRTTMRGSVQFKFLICTNGTKFMDLILSESHLTTGMEAIKAS